MGRHKYRARRTVYNGETFDSAAEANVAAILELRRKAGLIHGWCRGTAYLLVDGPTRTSRITYKPDFYVKTTRESAEVWDVKGVILPTFKLKAILWQKKFPHILLRAVDRNGNEIWRVY